MLRLAVTCGDCHETVAVVTLPELPPLVVSEVLEFPVRAVVRYLDQKQPGIRALFERAQRGEWSSVVDQLSALWLDMGVLVQCETCRRRM